MGMIGFSNMAKNVESAIQKAVVQWVRTNHPLVLIHATSNEHSFAKHSDYSLGIPDLLLFHRSGAILHCLFLELKTKKRIKEKDGGLRKTQIQWIESYLEDFAADNTLCEVAHGYTEAINIIMNWLLSEH